MKENKNMEKAWSDTGYWDDFYEGEPPEWAVSAYIYTWDKEAYKAAVVVYDNLIQDANAALNDFDNPERKYGRPPARMEFAGESGKIAWGSRDGERRFIPDRKRPHRRHFIKEGSDD